MSTKQKGLSIDQSKVRLALKFRREPHWHRLSAGGHIGFRKLRPDGGKADVGTWMARWRNAETGERKSAALGAVKDLKYDAAKAKAEAWFLQCADGLVKVGTVSEACRKYVEDRRKVKGDSAADAAATVFNAHVHSHKLGAKMLDKLRMTDIEEWRDSLVGDKRAKNSCNRSLRTFKAAMNFARKRKLIPAGHRPWEDVEAFGGKDAEDKMREVNYLVLEQRRLLLEYCSEDGGNFLKAMLHTAARPQEMRDATVADFDARQGVLKFSHYKGKGAKRRVRTFRLGADALKFFTKMVKDKTPLAPLMSQAGFKWERHQWRRAIQASIKAANEKLRKDDPAIKDEKLLPTGIVAYTMRHCAISDWLEAGEDVARVAKDAGTSIMMIDKYYDSHIRTTIESKRSNVKII